MKTITRLASALALAATLVGCGDNTAPLAPYCAPANLVTADECGMTNEDGLSCVKCWYGTPEHEGAHIGTCEVQSIGALCVLDCSQCGGAK